MKILIVEDEINVRQPLIDYLTREGFEVIAAQSIEEAQIQIEKKPDLVLLDWMLPDGQGIELLKQWQKQERMTPVIMLTARSETIDKVLGLELGADDYITKPFEPRELVARIRVRLRKPPVTTSRPSQAEHAALKQDSIETCGFVMNTRSHEAFYGKKNLVLTKTEFALLKLFLENPNQVFSREELLKSVWGYDNYPSTRTVDTHVLQLRQKSKAELFETVHGIGYRFRDNK